MREYIVQMAQLLYGRRGIGGGRYMGGYIATMALLIIRVVGGYTIAIGKIKC
jgi:hypothetical protein